MNPCNWIPDKIKNFFKQPKHIILILFCSIIVQAIGGLIYVYSVRTKIKSLELRRKERAPTHKEFFTPKEIAVIVKGVNEYMYELIKNHDPFEIDNLNKIINEEEEKLKNLRIRLARLQVQEANKTKIVSLTQKIELTEEKIEFYKQKRIFWRNRLNELDRLTVTFGIDSLYYELVNQSWINMNRPAPAPPSEPAISFETESPKLTFKDANQIAVTETIITDSPTVKKKETENIPVMADSFAENKKITEPVVIENQHTASSIDTNKVDQKSQFVNSKPMTLLSKDDMKTLLENNNFFDYYWNKNGHGFNNQFEVKIIEGDSVILDHASGLMWQQGGSRAEMDFETAQTWINKINREGFAGFDDWRLPRLEEAMNLMERKKNQHHLYIDSVFNDNQNWIWTADRLAGESKAWIVYFNFGYCSSYDFDYKIFVRAVRSNH